MRSFIHIIHFLTSLLLRNAVGWRINSIQKNYILIRTRLYIIFYYTLFHKPCNFVACRHKIITIQLISLVKINPFCLWLYVNEETRTHTKYNRRNNIDSVMTFSWFTFSFIYHLLHYQIQEMINLIQNLTNSLMTVKSDLFIYFVIGLSFVLGFMLL